MYLHHPIEEDEKHQDLSCDELRVSEPPLLDPANILDFLKPGHDEVLSFVKTGKPVSAMQYACWHRIVQEQLSCDKNANHKMKNVFKVATTCFRKIQSVHSSSESLNLRRFFWWIEYTRTEILQLRKLQNEAIYIPMDVALGRLSLSNNEESPSEDMAFLCAICFGVVMTIGLQCLIFCLVWISK